MKHLIKLYNTWERVKDIFVKPSLKVYFGKWINDLNLPIWRKGPQIFLCKLKHLSSKTYRVKSSVLIHTGNKKFKYGDKEVESACYEWTPIHKLPGKLKSGDYVWHRNIRKKLKKWHLSWLPPIITLPIWMRIQIFNLDLGYKIKFDEYRYEFPPQFTIVAFGLSLSFTLHAPINDDYCCDDHYWEAMLNYDSSKSKALKECIEYTGIITWPKDSKTISYFAVRPEYIKPEYLEEYYAAISEIKAKKNKVIL